MMDLVRIIGFQWDAGNARKSADKHGVTQAEAEQLFLNEPLLIINDAAHSPSEARCHALGRTHDSSVHVDWNKAERVRFSNLEPSTKSISIRLPVDLLERIRLAANKRDVPYQSLIKVWLAEKVDGDGGWLIENMRGNMLISV